MSQDAPFFSLILCAFDVEETIARAIASIRAQTFIDWELIVVDDCARDRSILRALRAASVDTRIRFIHNSENLGLAASRNHGLDQARGQYVCFPDAVDFCEPSYLALAHDAIVRGGADIVIEGVTQDHFNTRGELAYSETRSMPPTFAEGQEVAKLVLPLEEAKLLSFVYTKFFKRSLIRSLRFEETSPHFMEDFFFTLEAISRASSLQILSEAPYHFEHRLKNERNLSLVQSTFLVRHRRVAALLYYLQQHDLDTPSARAALASLYADHIMTELERLNAQENYVDAAERERWVGFLRSDPLFQMLLVDAEPTPGVLRSLVRKALVADSPQAALAVGRLSGYLKSFGPEQYARTQG